MNTLEIKIASSVDVPAILELLYELGRPKPTNDCEFEKFRKLITTYTVDFDKQILVAEYEDNKIIGLVSIVFLSRLNHFNLEMYIPELIVAEKYRTKGIGKKLIDSCIEIAKNKKCYRIRLESGNQRKNSHQFYKHLGFAQSAFSFTMNLT